MERASFVIALIALTVGINAKSCPDRLNELKSSKLLIGAFVPKCRPDGKYEETQCHGSTGFCFCVNPETGEEIQGTRIRGKPLCKPAPKSCSDRLNELKGSQPLLGAFVPKCRSDGKYKETQCHGSTGFCFCVNPETGEEIQGTRIRGKPSCKQTPCRRQRDEVLKKTETGLVGVFIPECSADGSYKKTQFYGSTGFYFCVLPETGEKLLGSDVRFVKPESCELTPCVKQRHEAMKSGLRGVFTPKCESDGSYESSQCHGKYCFCVFKDNGEEIKETRQEITQGPIPMLCEISQCVQHRHEAENSGLLGAFHPQCEDDGSYKDVQCHAGFCFCVFSDNGEEIPGTRMSVRGQKPKSCKAPACVQERHEAIQSNLMGVFIPDCEEDGSYKSLQSREGFYYCVFPDGTEILGTEMYERLQKPKTCNSTCILQRHEALSKEPGFVGGFMPKCEEDGTFNKTQCHGSTGYCFCVIPETGEKLLGTELRFKEPESCELTPCIKSRHDAMKSGLRGAFRPECEADGSYKQVQCHEGSCFCVFKDDGKEIQGTRLATKEKIPLMCRVAPCVKQRHEAANSGLLGAFHPKCEDDGSYKDVQCHAGFCFCVFSDNGEEIPGTRMNVRGQKPKSCKASDCVQKRHDAIQSRLMGVFIPDCEKDGSYKSMQSREGFYYCVFPETGVEILGTQLFERGQKPMSCDKPTACMLQRHIVLKSEKPMLGAFKPECNKDGSFKRVQCKEGFCYCAFQNGKEVLGTRQKVRGQRPKSCKLTSCVIKRHQGLSQAKMGLLGLYVPRCDDEGKYSNFQCWKTMCWCTDPLTGKQTKKNFKMSVGKPKCD